MTGLFSIMRRELAVGARQKATYLTRMWVGGTAVALFGAISMASLGSPNHVGSTLFSFSSILLFVQALLSGVQLTSDCLSEEKREGTLGLLFLTELKPWEVVLAKMGVRSLRGLYAMIAAIPIFALCVLLGGVRGVDVASTSIMILVTMLLSLAIGALVSARSIEDRSALIGSFAMVAGIGIAPLILWKLASLVTGSASWTGAALYFSPIYAFKMTPWTIRVSDFLGCMMTQIICVGGLAVLGVNSTGTVI